MIDKLALIVGVDLPFIEAGLTIHQPRLKELGYLGEEKFFQGLDLLNFSKERLSESDRLDLEIQDDFDIFMTMMIKGSSGEEQSLSSIAQSALDLLFLMFPEYEITLNEQGIMFQQEKDVPKFINKMNYSAFKAILNEMYCLDSKTSKAKDKYNVNTKKGQELANKFKEREKKLEELNGKDKKQKKVTSFYPQLIEVVATGYQLPLREVYEYTIYQIHKMFVMLQNKDSWDSYYQGLLAGASGMKEVEHWTSILFNK